MIKILISLKPLPTLPPPHRHRSMKTLECNLVPSLTVGAALEKLQVPPEYSLDLNLFSPETHLRI